MKQYETDEINFLPPQATQPTTEEIEECLELLNLARLRADQATINFKHVTEKPDITRKDVSQAFDLMQRTERQYMFLCDWLWEHTAHGFFFNHAEQKYVLRLKSSL